MVEILFKTLQQKAFKISAEPTDTIAALKQKIQDQEGHPAATQKIIYSGITPHRSILIEHVN
jgi:UV excision repair protein RAD23